MAAAFMAAVAVGACTAVETAMASTPAAGTQVVAAAAVVVVAAAAASGVLVHQELGQRVGNVLVYAGIASLAGARSAYLLAGKHLTFWM